MSDKEKRIQEITHELREYGHNSACYDGEFDRATALESADLIESMQRETEPVPNGCEVIKFARAGEKSNKLFSAHIFPEDQMLTVEVRAYNGYAQLMAGDHIPRSEYEKYDPFLVFEFYQKDSVLSLRDTCNWIIDTLEEKEKDAATEPQESKEPESTGDPAKRDNILSESDWNDFGILKDATDPKGEPHD